MLPLRHRIRVIGGGRAQRDLFAQMVIQAALKCDKYPLARALLHERTVLKPNSAQAWNLLATALEGEGKTTDAAVPGATPNSCLRVNQRAGYGLSRYFVAPNSKCAAGLRHGFLSSYVVVFRVGAGVDGAG